MAILFPEDRSGKEAPPPPHWTIFDPKQHEPPRGVIATLDDLTGWTAEAAGVSGAFGVSPELALWGKTGAFIDVSPAPAPGHITLRPPAPIPIPDDADLFELWITGDAFDWERKNPQFALQLLTKSLKATEETFISMADAINWPTYSVRIIKIPVALRHDAVVTGIRLSGHDPERPRRFGLNRLCAYRDVRKPLILAPRPKRPLRLPPGQSPGLHTGPGQLPFPTREQTILPDNLTTDFTNSVERIGDAIYFRYSGDDAAISYHWSPGDDPFRLVVQVDGHDAAEAMADVVLGRPENLAWFSPEWRMPEEMEPLPLEARQAIPTAFTWRGEKAPPLSLDGLETDVPANPPYDVARHGSIPVYHYFREIVADHAAEITLAFIPPKENLAVWLNGAPIHAMTHDKKPAHAFENGTWKLPLRPGKNLLAVMFCTWPTGYFGVKPLAADAKWSGPWRVFGPMPHQAGARPCNPTRLSVRSLALEKNTAVAVFDAGTYGPLTVEMRLWAKSMIVDLHCPSGAVSLFEPGRFRNLVNGRAQPVPAMKSNAVLLAKANERTVFFTCLHDWYRSNASSWTSRVECDGNEARLQGPILYKPKTDGAKNPLHERYLLTCSPVYEEVLPTIPNPPSPWAVEAGRYVFQESWGPTSFEKELAKAKRWATLGMTDILHLHHEAGWGYQYFGEEGTASTRKWVNDGCTLRLDISPHKGGNKAMKKFLAAEQALGLRAGLYTNYTDYYPLNSLFFSDRTILRPDGSRQTAWVHSYKMKPSLAVEYDAWFAPRIAREFHPDTAYTDVHTSIPPWDRVDYDERVPGAATFAATYYADGELLLNDQRHYCGPVFSEGGLHHWMYAGLASGNYGQIGIRREDPPDPAFNLLKIHPLQTDVGLSVGVRGWIEGNENIEEQVDRYILAVLTYGHIAYLPEEPFEPRLLLRIYHMTRAVTSRCAGLRPVAIHYQNEAGQWLTVSEAHACGLGDHCRLRIRYPGDMTLYANWSQTRTWTLLLTHEGGTLLPPNGYLLETTQGVLCASSMRDGFRWDRAETTDGWYVDGRGKEVQWGPLTVNGCAALLLDPGKPASRRLIDGGGNTVIRIGKLHAPRRYQAISADNKLLAKSVAKRDEEDAIIEPVPGAIRYKWNIAK